MVNLGLLINPVAGMGGRVGLKGTDGLVQEALMRGASPGSLARTVRFLRALPSSDVLFLTCSGDMGEAAFIEAGYRRCRVVYRYSGESTAADTKEACRTFLREGVSLILFCGGDGTARDVLEGSGGRTPILGIPAGVKMYSGVFALTPESAAALVSEWNGQCREAEVLDVDEDAYRKGELRTRLYGFARVPAMQGMVQHSKDVFESSDEESAKADIAMFLAEVIMGTPKTLYLLGPGSTTLRIASAFGLEKSLLGFDAVMGGHLVGRDLDERAILALLEKTDHARIIVSPLGMQGAVLGRGTQQISPGVIRKVGVENVIVIATPQKLAGTPSLFVDTGDPALDRAFGGTIRVITGYHVARRRALLSPAEWAGSSLR
ncbi:MAG: ATP-NAD kinase family protein [Methanomicrobiales archaeon]|nr:ATP-NAD kinase family protein [Methanomicrobiales archaeon]